MPAVSSCHLWQCISTTKGLKESLFRWQARPPSWGTRLVWCCRYLDLKPEGRNKSSAEVLNNLPYSQQETAPHLGLAGLRAGSLAASTPQCKVNQVQPSCAAMQQTLFTGPSPLPCRDPRPWLSPVNHLRLRGVRDHLLTPASPQRQARRLAASSFCLRNSGSCSSLLVLVPWVRRPWPKILHVPQWLSHKTFWAFWAPVPVFWEETSRSDLFLR